MIPHRPPRRPARRGRPHRAARPVRSGEWTAGGARWHLAVMTVRARPTPPAGRPAARRAPAHRACARRDGLGRAGAARLQGRRHADQAPLVRRLEPVAARHDATACPAPTSRPTCARPRMPASTAASTCVASSSPTSRRWPGRPSRRCAALGPVGVPQLRDPEVDIRLLGPRPRLCGRAQGERPGRSQRAPARHDASTSGATAARRPGITRTGARPRPGHG